MLSLLFHVYSIIIYFAVGNVFGSAYHDILQLAKKTNMEGKVHQVTFGFKDEMSKLKDILAESMTSGHWVVIQNTHLVKRWSADVLKLIKVRKGCKECAQLWWIFSITRWWILI